MKKSELFFSALQVPIDYMMLVLAGALSFWLRGADEIRDILPLNYVFSPRQYAQILLTTAAFFIAVFALDGMYYIRSNKSVGKELYRVFRAVAIGLILIVLGVFFNRDWYSSRFVILSGGVFAVLLISSARILLRAFQHFLLAKKGIGIHRLVLVGSNGICLGICKQIKARPDLGYKVVGQTEGVNLDELRKIKEKVGIDEIIECNPSQVKLKELHLLKEFCLHNRITFKYVPALVETTNFNLEIFLGEPMIEVKNTPLDGWGKIAKRLFDLLGATVGVILLGPIMLLIYLGIFIQSGHPVIFFNQRMGHKGPFDLFKFRYMKRKYSHGRQFSGRHNQKALTFLENLIKEQSIKKGPVYKIKDDPRKTRLGAWLEKYSLDELPQFFNVLKGNMSLVGPRPHQPIEVDKYQEHQKRVLTIKPGITGMAQVSGRSDLSFNDEVRLDVYYIENWSLWLDILIILKTFPALWKKRRN